MAQVVHRAEASVGEREYRYQCNGSAGRIHGARPCSARRKRRDLFSYLKKAHAEGRISRSLGYGICANKCSACSRKEDRECKTLSVLFLSARVYCSMSDTSSLRVLDGEIDGGKIETLICPGFSVFCGVTLVCNRHNCMPLLLHKSRKNYWHKYCIELKQPFAVIHLTFSKYQFALVPLALVLVQCAP